ncbi:MAG: lipid biosynthesis B12-binding/radical SAM protein [Pseudodesulfovibrio sp.]|nr:lipid biosynthesis B12-binding/radical SAM protein [Pseudodesulfovibrio sp.]
MARILLISTNTTTEPYPVYPLGMSVIASALNAAGHTVRQFDFLMAKSSLECLGQALIEFRPDMTGISLRNIDNVDSLSSDTNWYLGNVKEVTAFLKAQEQTVIVGGPGFSLMPDDILDFLGADHGVVGEGERKIVKLVSMIESGVKTPKIFKAESGLQSKDMHTPLWDQALVDFYLEQSGIVNIQTKRGCENRCNYCSYPTIEGRVIRPRDAAEVAEEIEKLHRKFNVETIFFTDSVFNDSHGHYLEVAEHLARRNLPVQWSAFFQPTLIKTADLKLLKRSGLQAMEVGTDASTDATLTAMGKPFLFEDVIRFNKACVSEHIPCAHFVIFGGLDETPKTVQQGINNLNELDNCVVFPFSGIRLYKGTPLYSHAKREGIISPDTSLLKPLYYFSPQIDPDAMNEALIKGFSGRRDRIFPPSDGQDRMNVLRRFGYRGLLWDTLIKFPETEKQAQPIKDTVWA